MVNQSLSRRSSTRIRRSIALLWLAFAPLLAFAQSPLLATIENYLRIQTNGLPGKVAYSIGELDPRTRLGACGAFEPFLPAGGKLWGKTTVGVRCLGPSAWTIYVPVQVTVSGNYVVSARNLSAGHVVGPADVAVRSGDLSALPATVVTDVAQAVGKTVKSGLAAGQVVRNDRLTAPWAVLQGQSVRLTSNGPGFSVSSEGTAINNAAAGQVVQVRTASGQSVRGIAQPNGSVEVMH